MYAHFLIILIFNFRLCFMIKFSIKNLFIFIFSQDLFKSDFDMKKSLYSYCTTFLINSILYLFFIMIYLDLENFN